MSHRYGPLGSGLGYMLSIVPASIETMSRDDKDDSEAAKYWVPVCPEN